MPFTVQDLIEDKLSPVLVKRSDSAVVALKRMIEGDYSQLPVVDDDDKVVGMITSDSIIRALSHFSLTINDIRVFHAIDDVRKFRPEDDLFGLLDDLKNTYAVVVVDNDEKMIGIVTNYDTAEYFRRRGEDIMLVEDIESMLKDYILAAFQNESGETDDRALQAAIEEITPSNSGFRANFNRALSECVQNNLIDGNNLQRNPIESVFAQHLDPRSPSKPFDRLTLGEYIEMFLHRSRWDRYQPVFALPADACRRLLDQIREIRNALAHFRADLSSEQRQQLRYCKEWLAQHQQEVFDAFAPPILDATSARATEAELQEQAKEIEGLLSKIRSGDNTDENSDDSGGYPTNVIEELTPSESRYAQLAIFLQRVPESLESVQLAFADIEEIIRTKLPKTAYEHRSWWANDSVSHVQSKQWLEVGWRVSNVNVSQCRVTFSRIRDREQKYIAFFSDLLTALRERDGFPLRSISPTGRSSIGIDFLTSEANDPITYLGCSFARGGNFRVELYIDTGDPDYNRVIFEGLKSHNERIEKMIDTSLDWESLERRRASRIAAYHPGSITDPDTDLAQLRQWAVETITQFYQTFQIELRKLIVQFYDDAYSGDIPLRSSVSDTTN